MTPTNTSDTLHSITKRQFYGGGYGYGNGYDGLSNGARIGIGVGIAVGVLILIALFGALASRRRRRNASSIQPLYNTNYTPNQPYNAGQNSTPYYPQSELQQNQSYQYPPQNQTGYQQYGPPTGPPPAAENNHGNYAAPPMPPPTYQRGAGKEV